MKLDTRNLRRELAELKATAAERVRTVRTFDRYRADPCRYADEVLNVRWWEKQREIAKLLLEPPHRVLVKASHSVGKSHLAGGLVNWWYDTHDPGVVLTTAPTARQVRDVLWKEVRRQRGGRGGFPGPKIPRLESSPFHFAHGLTANNATSFQGQHELAVLIILDEAVGVDREIWEAADSMVMGVKFAFLAICNPTDVGSEFYQREQRGGSHVVHISCLDHPNIGKELRGEEPDYPSAVRLAWLEERLAEWCEPVLVESRPTDIEWPPGSGKFLRPGPLAEARLLGRWPSAGSGVWSDALWAAVESCRATFGVHDLPEIGCDVARFGDDNTEFHVRVGPVSMHHESHNGLGNDEVAGRLRNLCREWAAWATARRVPQAAPIRPESIRCKVDDDGMGGRITDFADGYNWVPVRASAACDGDYPNVRSELWFVTAERARKGRLSLASLPEKVRRELKRQAVAPHYKLDAAGRRVVEPKQDTKDTLGRSPDGMDALNLAYYEGGGVGAAQWVGGERQHRSYRDRHKG